MWREMYGFCVWWFRKRRLDMFILKIMRFSFINIYLLKEDGKSHRGELQRDRPELWQ